MKKWPEALQEENECTLLPKNLCHSEYVTFNNDFMFLIVNHLNDKEAFLADRTQPSLQRKQIILRCLGAVNRGQGPETSKDLYSNVTY